MDQANLDKQMMEEDEKAGRLRQKHLTPDDAKTMANNTKMTNDVVYVTDPALILWHKRVTDILKKKWWDVPAGQMDQKLFIASQVFIHWPHDKIDPDKYKTKPTKLKLMNDHLKWIKERSETMIGCIKKFGEFHPLVHNNDFLSFFVRPIPRVFGEEIVMEVVEEAIINRCTTVDPHYNYHSKTNYAEEDSSCALPTLFPVRSWVS